MAGELREDTVEIIGTVTMARVSRPRMALIAWNGQEIEAPCDPSHEEIITTALKEHATAKVRVRGRGQFSAAGKIEKITRVDEITLLPAGESSVCDRKPIWEVFAEILKDIPDEELRKLPRDGAANHDHYIYGLPKREP